MASEYLSSDSSWNDHSFSTLEGLFSSTTGAMPTRGPCPFLLLITSIAAGLLRSTGYVRTPPAERCWRVNCSTDVKHVVWPILAALLSPHRGHAAEIFGVSGDDDFFFKERPFPSRESWILNRGVGELEFGKPFDYLRSSRWAI